MGPHLRRACRPDEGRLTDNVLAALPKSAHPGAKKALAEIWNAEDKSHARDAVKEFESTYGAKFPKAVAKISDDFEQLLAFYDFPAEHWIHLRTTNPWVIWSAARDRGCDLHVCFVEGVYDAPGDGCRCRSARPDRYRTEMGRFVAPARVVAELAEGACELAA